MQQSKPSSDAERPDENPYAPPKAEISSAVEEGKTDEAGSQRQKHLRRETCIRITGLLSLILATIVLLSFGLGTLYEFQKTATGEVAIEAWIYRRWVARMATVNSLAFVATVTSWGLFQLRNWGRWALTIVLLVPFPILLFSLLLRNCSEAATAQESVDSIGLIALSIVLALSCTPQLFLLWSPKGRTVFSAGYRKIIEQTPKLRGGCLGFLQALLIIPASFASYLVLMVTTLNTLVILGLIRSF
jgi:hypothetical protein